MHEEKTIAFVHQLVINYERKKLLLSFKHIFIVSRSKSGQHWKETIEKDAQQLLLHKPMK